MLEEVIAGKKKITVVIEDPFGNSAIISKKAITTKLSKEEAEKLNNGMIVFDIEKSEFTHKALENVQLLEGN
jgi:zinc finger protein